ncbi:MAG: hypothetical protein IPO78_12435 [Saprospiraceae bacterium]|nr:hypothetical protein [Saprospiraceae bacterium]MBK8483237.1 hypothetical protein [Saprospiraceae bacterium]MBK9220749.1 hypothetical protein [Saprospiraceae bacterium]MBK9722406.1 hypothetical protein [Saprospiraceae bacterium]MBK9729430.1 hypothetical protein [Saprospiraceae bacterium]
MAKLLYYFLLLITALLLYNWFFIPAKTMSSGQSEKDGLGIITIIACLVSCLIGFLYYTGNQKWGNLAIYTLFGIGIIWLIYLILHVRWN